MNCENCGAPMRLVRDRDYFVCDYCGAFYFPDPNPDGIRVLNEPSDTLCPVCKMTLVVAALEDFRVLHCPNCKGNLIEQAAFGRAVASLHHHPDAQPLPQPLNRKELKRPLQCPRCGRLMDTHPYGGAGNVVIDNCADCALVWLDGGELNRIITAPDEERLEDDASDEFGE